MCNPGMLLMGANMYQAWRVAFSTRMLLKQIRYIIDEEVDGDDMDYFKEEALGEWMHTTYGDMSKPSLYSEAIMDTSLASDLFSVITKRKRTSKKCIYLSTSNINNYFT